MPYKDPDKRRAYHKEYMRRRRAGVKPESAPLLSPGLNPLKPEMRTYVCKQYPFLRIRNLKFFAGVLTVDNEEDIKLVESQDWFGVFVHPQESLVAS